MTESKFAIGDKVTLSIKALNDTRFMDMVKLDGTSEYTVRAIDSTLGYWFYQVSTKLPTGTTYTEPIYIREDFLVSASEVFPDFEESKPLELEFSNPLQPDHYNANDDNDLIAMWIRIMKPNEFRRTMFSHISKYLFRYPDKNYQEDFDKAKEYIRRLEKWEHETGQFGKEATK